MFKFNKYYFGIAVMLFNAEVLIADFMHDTIIRPYGGDFIVVILVYCMVKAFIKTGVLKTAIGTLIFAYLVEITQFFHLIDQLGWGHSALARNLLGTTFRWLDMLAYTLGIILVGLLESWLSVLKRVELREVNG